MTVNYNVTGARRKEMTRVISEALDGWEVKYLGAPTFAYQIGDFEVTRTGALVFSDRTDGKEVETVLEALAQAGFECEAAENVEDTSAETEIAAEDTESATAEDVKEQSDTSNEPIGKPKPTEKTEPQEQQEDFVEELSISLPNDLDEHARQNLDAAIAGKATLLKAAFLTESLAYKEDEKKLTFPWFKYSSPENRPEETNAYMLFLTHLVSYAKEAKRVTVKDKAVDNPRYAFRCFLLRLGFIGQEFKAARKILMRNLAGNSSFKSGHRKEADGHEVSE